MIFWGKLFSFRQDTYQVSFLPCLHFAPTHPSTRGRRKCDPSSKVPLHPSFPPHQITRYSHDTRMSNTKNCQSQSQSTFGASNSQVSSLFSSVSQMTPQLGVFHVHGTSRVRSSKLGNSPRHRSSAFRNEIGDHPLSQTQKSK